jgi:predicted permease
MPQAMGMGWAAHFGRDLRHSVRMLVRMPVLSAVVVGSLAVGIGMNTAVFTWVQAIVFRPLPGVQHASEFLLVLPRSEMGTYPGSSWPEYRDLAGRLPSVRELVGFRREPLEVGEVGQSERMPGLMVSDNYFSALGLVPAAGRFLRPDEVTAPGGAPVVVISHDYWRTRLAGTAGAVGSTLRVNDVALTIIGVTPEGFRGTTLGLVTHLWVPATLAPVLRPGSDELERRTARGYQLMGRPVAGATLEQVGAEMTRAMEELALQYPASNETMQGEVLPFGRAPAGPQRMFINALWVLQAVMVLLLLVVCGNTANLVLARASSRDREIGMRMAVGAGRGRVLSLLLTENLLLGLLGAGLGAAVAVWVTEFIRPDIVVAGFSITFNASVDGTSLALAMLLGVLSGVAFGLAPAIQLSRVDPQLALRAGSQRSPRHWARSALMATEVALAMVVLIAAASFVRGFLTTQETDPGFRRAGVLLLGYGFSGVPRDASFTRPFSSRLLERLRALPGVDAAGIASQVPLDIHGMPLGEFSLEGRASATETPDRALVQIVTPGYFETLGIPLRSGSDFADFNDAATPPQVLVNEEFVARFLDDGEAVGRRLEASGRQFVIAGVVANSLYEAFGEPPKAITYFSYRDRPQGRGEIFLRTRAGSETLLASAAQRAIRELEPSLPVFDIRTLTEHVDRNLFLRRIPAQIFGVLGPLLLLLAAVGIYAVVAHAVARRTAEIGIRLALGASAGRVIRQVVGENMTVIGFGALAGWVVAFMVVRLLPGGAIDVAIFGGVPVILLGVATLASWLPARSVARLDPMVALRLV